MLISTWAAQELKAKMLWFDIPRVLLSFMEEIVLPDHMQQYPF